MQDKEHGNKTPNGIEVIYDSECPICRHFACSIREADNVNLVDARQSSRLQDESQRRNLDIDKGSVVHIDGRFLYGPEAFHYIANHVESKGLMGFASRYLFRYRPVANIVYPIFVACRRLLLKLLGKPLINEKSEHSTESCAPLSVYYNSACPVCDAGIKHQKNRMKACQISWKDVHSDNAVTSELDSELEFVRKRLHVIDPSGEIHIGIDAFIALWKYSPGEKWKANLLSSPLIHGIAALLYNGFAALLYRYNRWKKHW